MAYGEKTISDKDKEFADKFSDFVNGRMDNPTLLGCELANDHRYLIQEKAKVAFSFLEQLAYNYLKGCYDGRDEWACKLAYQAITTLVKNGEYYSKRIEELLNKQK